MRRWRCSVSRLEGSGHAVNAEIAKNHVGIANRDLPMGSVAKACAGIDEITFFKDIINSVVSIHLFALADLVHQLDHGAVELTLHEDAVLPN